MNAYISIILYISIFLTYLKSKPIFFYIPTSERRTNKIKKPYHVGRSGLKFNKKMSVNPGRRCQSQFA